jgi:general secretion pathway protein C
MSLRALPHRWIALALTLVALAVAAWWVIQAVWLVLEPDPVSTNAPLIAPTIGPTARTTSLQGLNLFGESAQAQAQAVEEIINAPLTSLKLKLTGTVADAAGREGMAVIVDEGGRAARYMIGDALPGGAVLKRVLWDRVVIERLGQQELLKLPRLTASSAPSSPATALGGPIALPNAMAGFAQNDAAPAPAAPATVPAAPLNSWEDTLQQARETVDVAAIQAMVDAQAVQENGKVVGYKLGAGTDPAFLARLGLAPTDVVIAVNGQVLSDPTQTLTILAGLQNASSANVRIRRLGVEQDLTVTLNR